MILFMTSKGVMPSAKTLSRIIFVLLLETPFLRPDPFLAPPFAIIEIYDCFFNVIIPFDSFLLFLHCSYHVNLLTNSYFFFKRIRETSFCFRLTQGVKNYIPSLTA